MNTRLGDLKVWQIFVAFVVGLLVTLAIVALVHAAQQNSALNRGASCVESGHVNCPQP